MTILEQITALVESEVERKLNERMNKYVEYISKTYDISYRLLLKDLRNITELEIPSTSGRGAAGTTPGQCMGFTKRGDRCKSSGKHKGYCYHHKCTSPTSIAAVPSTTDADDDDGGVKTIVQHNHSLPPLYSPDCPACLKLKHVPSKDKLLIEI